MNLTLDHTFLDFFKQSTNSVASLRTPNKNRTKEGTSFSGAVRLCVERTKLSCCLVHSVFHEGMLYEEQTTSSDKNKFVSGRSPPAHFQHVSNIRATSVFRQCRGCICVFARVNVWWNNFKAPSCSIIVWRHQNRCQRTVPVEVFSDCMVLETLVSQPFGGDCVLFHIPSFFP